MPAQRPGFTLIELLFFLLLLAVLAGAAQQAWRAAWLRAGRAEGRAALLAAMQEQESHFSRHQRYVAFNAGAAQGYKWYSGPSAPASAYEISAAACPGSSLSQCVLLVAQPGTARVNSRYRDPACGSLSLSSSGAQAASGSAGQACW